MKNNIIIAGVPRAGKSTLSHIISQKYGYQHVSMDAIVAGFENVFPELEILSHLMTIRQLGMSNHLGKKGEAARVITTPQEYLDSLSGAGKEWFAEFWAYMNEKHPEYSITMFRQRPIYKKEDSYLKGYLMFTVAKSHFTVHTLYFDIIEEMKNTLPGTEFNSSTYREY